jgi:hypothetical protein
MFISILFQEEEEKTPAKKDTGIERSSTGA